jgi:hypothetical protein
MIKGLHEVLARPNVTELSSDCYFYPNLSAICQKK